MLARRLDVVFSGSFKRDFKRLVEGDQRVERRLEHCVELLRSGVHTAGMNLEKIEGYERIRGLRSVRLSDELRMSVIIGETLTLLRINHHDDLYDNPV